jgi:hypothetical protein
MNYQLAATALVLSGALAFGAAGCSSSTSDQQGQVPPPAATSELAPNPGAQPSATGRTSFADLAGNKGYITQQDAQQDPWLSDHFQQCDSNHDNRVSRQEYDQCKQQNGRGMMQQQPRQMPQQHSNEQQRQQQQQAPVRQQPPQQQPQPATSSG